MRSVIDPGLSLFSTTCPSEVWDLCTPAHRLHAFVIHLDLPLLALACTELLSAQQRPQRHHLPAGEVKIACAVGEPVRPTREIFLEERELSGVLPIHVVQITYRDLHIVEQGAGVDGHFHFQGLALNAHQPRLPYAVSQLPPEDYRVSRPPPALVHAFP
eukprot:CAMPEP_0173240662 /NCGR_PEP_ID=MMETSP1142-20121109/13917_1 /TAXON_ID=483371 /ORGANISM="non described non described, Strain CCMP2298" /LENGTH=158 /DNA_ID=CAMNT_0014171861 /DNA_START=203 /DNA_END=679 /DNA_ORIENTATION=+